MKKGKKGKTKHEENELMPVENHGSGGWPGEERIDGVQKKSDGKENDEVTLTTHPGRGISYKK